MMENDLDVDCPFDSKERLSLIIVETIIPTIAVTYCHSCLRR